MSSTITGSRPSGEFSSPQRQTVGLWTPTSTYHTPNPSPHSSLIDLITPRPTYQPPPSNSAFATPTYQTPGPSSSSTHAYILNRTPATIIVPPTPPPAPQRRMSQFSILSPLPPPPDEEAAVAQQRPSSGPSCSSRFILRLRELLKGLYNALKEFIGMFSCLWNWDFWKGLFGFLWALFWTFAGAIFITFFIIGAVIIVWNGVRAAISVTGTGGEDAAASSNDTIAGRAMGVVFGKGGRD